MIIPIYKNDNDKENVITKVNEIANILELKNIRIHIDSREELTPGYKFNDWELKGVPLRIEIGPKDIENQSMVLAKRYNHEKMKMGLNENWTK